MNLLAMKTEHDLPPPYADKDEPLILRDHLAIERTRMANERTLLAWVRTALMMLVSGITLLKLFQGVAAMEALGGVLVPTSLLVAAVGGVRCWRAHTSIKAALDK